MQRKTLKRIKKNQKPSFFGTRENTCRKVFQQPAELRLQQVKMVDAAASQVLTRSSSARLLATELICASRPSHPAHSHHRRRPWRKRDGAHPTPHALHARSRATLIMRAMLLTPDGARTAEVPTRRWTPGAGEAPQVSMAAVVDLFTKKPWNEPFLDSLILNLPKKELFWRVGTCF